MSVTFVSKKKNLPALPHWRMQNCFKWIMQALYESSFIFLHHFFERITIQNRFPFNSCHSISIFPSHTSIERNYVNMKPELLSCIGLWPQIILIYMLFKVINIQLIYILQLHFLFDLFPLSPSICVSHRLCFPSYPDALPWWPHVPMCSCVING